MVSAAPRLCGSTLTLKLQVSRLMDFELSSSVTLQVEVGSSAYLMCLEDLVQTPSA